MDNETMISVRKAYDNAIAERNRLRERNAELLAALLYIVNDCEPGESAVLSVDGYNMACAAIEKNRS